MHSNDSFVPPVNVIQSLRCSNPEAIKGTNQDGYKDGWLFIHCNHFYGAVEEVIVKTLLLASPNIRNAFQLSVTVFLNNFYAYILPIVIQ